jgi:hypothetical protein
MNTGKVSDWRIMVSKIENYVEARTAKRKLRAYGDVAYVEGYICGLSLLLEDDDERLKLPMWYLFGVGPIGEFDKYREKSKAAATVHKTSYVEAVRLSRGVPADMIFDHTHFL